MVLLKENKIPDPNISLSLLKARHSTASSIIMKFSAAWYLRSFRILPVVKFHTWTKAAVSDERCYL
jgi:hypothetical protein